MIPAHKWVHSTDGRVWILKFVDENQESFGGFIWPEKGPVHPDYCTTAISCDTGGLFGWPWGFGFGEGKKPLWTGKTIIFAAPPEQVIRIGDKVKVAADTPADVKAEVLYCGDFVTAWEMLKQERKAYLAQETNGDFVSEEKVVVSNGSCQVAAATTYQPNMAAITKRICSVAVTSGANNFACAKGNNSVAVAMCHDSLIEVASGCLGVGMAADFYWRVRRGASVVAWTPDGYKLLVADDLGLEDGGIYKVYYGEIQ